MPLHFKHAQRRSTEVIVSEGGSFGFRMRKKQGCFWYSPRSIQLRDIVESLHSWWTKTRQASQSGEWKTRWASGRAAPANYCLTVASFLQPICSEKRARDTRLRSRP